MIGVRDVVVVGNIRDNSETLLQALGELVSRGLHRSSVEGIADILSCSPLSTLIVQLLHNLESELFAVRISMGYTQHSHGHLIETCVTKGDGGVITEEQFVNRLTLLQTCQSAILPKDGSYIRACAHETLMAATQCPMAELKPLFEDFPETLHISIRRTCNINEVDGNNTLVETSIILMLAGNIATDVSDILLIAGSVIGSQEASASHARVYIALITLHDLSGDIVRNHTLCSTFCSEHGKIVEGAVGSYIVLIENVDDLRECRGNPYALLILDALNTLF